MMQNTRVCMYIGISSVANNIVAIQKLVPFSKIEQEKFRKSKSYFFLWRYYNTLEWLEH